ncbi:hypothetical protein D9M71_462520 [compost metagenome]
MQAGFEAVDPCRTDIVRNVVGAQGDRIAQVGAVQRRLQPGGFSQLAAPLQFVAFRALGLEVGVAKVRVVEVIEGRRAEAFAVGQQQVVVRVERQAEAGAPAVLAAELLVLVAAHAHFGAEAVALVAVLHKGGAVPAAVFVQGRAAVQAVLVPVATQQQVVVFVEAQVILPVQRIAIGVELATARLQRVALGITVFAVAQLQA